MSHKANDIITDTVKDWVACNDHDELIRAMGQIEELEAEVLRLNVLLVNAKAQFDEIAAMI